MVSYRETVLGDALYERKKGAYLNKVALVLAVLLALVAIFATIYFNRKNAPGLEDKLMSKDYWFEYGSFEQKYEGIEVVREYDMFFRENNEGIFREYLYYRLPEGSTVSGAVVLDDGTTLPGAYQSVLIDEKAFTYTATSGRECDITIDGKTVTIKMGDTDEYFTDYDSLLTNDSLAYLFTGWGY